MRPLRDTILHYLADNLDVVVHPLRRSPDNEGLSTPRSNAVNVQFMKDDLAITGATAMVSIDVLDDDENNCMDVVQQVWHLLNVTGSIPKLDYSTGSPVETGTNVSWDSNRVSFRYIYSLFYYHYSCLLILTHTPQL